MPPVREKMSLSSSRTNPELIAARFLLKPGRKYEQAVKAFEPYDSIKEENPEAGAAERERIAEGKGAVPGRRTFVFVNNRLEWKAISAIATTISSGANHSACYGNPTRLSVKPDAGLQPEHSAGPGAVPGWHRSRPSTGLPSTGRRTDPAWAAWLDEVPFDSAWPRASLWFGGLGFFRAVLAPWGSGQQSKLESHEK